MAYHVLKPWLHAVGNPGPLGLYAFGLSTAFLQVSCCNESLVKPVLLHALLQRVHRSWRAMHVSGQGRLHATLIILHCLGGPWRIMWAWRLALSCSTGLACHCCKRSMESCWLAGCRDKHYIARPNQGHGGLFCHVLWSAATTAFLTCLPCVMSDKDVASQRAIPPA